MRALGGLAALAVAVALTMPHEASGNGGVSTWVDERTEGAVLPGDGAPFVATALAKDEEVECASEFLTLELREREVRVTVEYVLRNDGPEKQIEYGFPFAIGEQDLIDAGGMRIARTFGKPRSYQLTVDGKPLKAEWRRGLELPREIPVPAIQHNAGMEGVLEARLETRYRWYYFVSPVTLPAGREVKLKVTYGSPWLVYTKANSETGRAESPPSFSYLLSTGSGWKGGVIRKLKIVVREAGGTLPAAGIDGLPFVRKGKVATFEGVDVRPTREIDLFVRGSEFTPIEFTADADLSPTKPWVSPPVGGAAPAVLRLALYPAYPQAEYGQRNRSSQRHRLGIDTSRSAAQPARVRVVVGLAGGKEDVFHATFGEAAKKDVAAAGYRYVYFDEPTPPLSLRLEFLDVHPAPNGDRRLRVSGITVEDDSTNYTAFVPTPR